MHNRFIKFWFLIFGLHALHQLEESISFFQWYIDNSVNIPGWLLIINVENAKTFAAHPGYFILATFLQFLIVLIVAVLFRHKEKATVLSLYVYLIVLSFFLIWHILISYITHSYPPIMVTCIGGLFLIPVVACRIFRLSRENTN